MGNGLRSCVRQSTELCKAIFNGDLHLCSADEEEKEAEAGFMRSKTLRSLVESYIFSSFEWERFVGSRSRFHEELKCRFEQLELCADSKKNKMAQTKKHVPHKEFFKVVFRAVY